MATNTGKGFRRGAVKARSQTQTPNGTWVKRDKSSGQFIAQKSDGQPFKGVRREA